MLHSLKLLRWLSHAHTKHALQTVLLYPELSIDRLQITAIYVSCQHTIDSMLLLCYIYIRCLLRTTSVAPKKSVSIAPVKRTAYVLLMEGVHGYTA